MLNHSPEAKAILQLVIETMKLAPKLQLQGDKLTEGYDLTSSRWNFIAIVATSEQALSVADIARRMHLKRQTVQRFADATAGQGLIEFKQNPDHKRAKLVAITQKGKKALAKMEKLELDWAETVAINLSTTDIQQATNVLRLFRENVANLSS